MLQPVSAVAPSNIINMTSAITALEDQQHTLNNMLNALENILYGSDTAEPREEKKQNDGFETRLSDLVASNEKALSRLDRVISKL
jgi:hypothetical protein